MHFLRAAFFLAAATVGLLAGQALSVRVAWAAVPVYIRINFQRPESVTPAGFLADTGGVYGLRNGLTYGWTLDVTAGSRDRNATNSPNQAYDTLNHFQKTNPAAVWELELANGTYYVRAVCGDPSYTDSVYVTNAESVNLVNGTPNNNNLWLTGTKQVTVTDGKLTISSGTGASNNKLCFIEISDQTLPAVNQTPDAPPQPAYEDFAFNVSFQPFNVPIPENFIAEDGLVYGARGNGFTYGWNTAHGNTYDRNSVLSKNQAYDTGVILTMNNGEKWELQVPASGAYTIFGAAGDATVTSGATYRFAAEGTTFINGTPSSSNPWVEGSATVNVTDGRLTITNAGGAQNNRLCFLQIASTAIGVANVTATPPRAPAAGVETTLMNNILAWLSSSVLFYRDSVTYFETVNGGTFVDPRATSDSLGNILTANGTNANLFVYSKPAILQSSITVPDNSVAAPPSATKLLNVYLAVGAAGALQADGAGLPTPCIVIALGRYFTTTTGKTGANGKKVTLATVANQLGIAFGGAGQISSDSKGTGGNGADVNISGSGRGFAVGGKAGNGGASGIGGNAGKAEMLALGGGIAIGHNGGTGKTGGAGGYAIVKNGNPVVFTVTGQGVSYTIAGDGGQGSSTGGAGGAGEYYGFDGTSTGGKGGNATGGTGGNGGWSTVNGTSSYAQAGAGGQGTAKGGRGGDANAYGSAVVCQSGNGGLATASGSTGGDAGNAFAFGSGANWPIPLYNITALGGTGGKGARYGGKGGDAYALANAGFAFAVSGAGGEGTASNGKGGTGGDATATANAGDATALGGTGGSSRGAVGAGGKATATAPNGIPTAVPGAPGTLLP